MGCSWDYPGILSYLKRSALVLKSLSSVQEQSKNISGTPWGSLFDMRLPGAEFWSFHRCAAVLSRDIFKGL